MAAYDSGAIPSRIKDKRHRAIVIFIACAGISGISTWRPDKGRTILHFGAVDYHAQVWVNGRELRPIEGGHTPFSADITFGAQSSEKQTITVQVEDDPLDLTKPRGKQDWHLEPRSIWYHRTTGIWQTVWLERSRTTYIGKIRWTPHIVGFALHFEVRISGELVPDLKIESSLRHTWPSV